MNASPSASAAVLLFFINLGAKYATRRGPASTCAALPAIDGEEVAAPLLDPTASTGKRWVGVLTAAASLGLGVYLWCTDRARAVMSAGPMLGGLGPFVRERTAPAPQVV